MAIRSRRMGPLGLPGGVQHMYTGICCVEVAAAVSPRHVSTVMVRLKAPCCCRFASPANSAMTKEKHSILPSKTPEGFEERQTPPGETASQLWQPPAVSMMIKFIWHIHQQEGRDFQTCIGQIIRHMCLPRGNSLARLAPYPLEQDFDNFTCIRLGLTLLG